MYLTGGFPNSVIVDDFNNDSYPDIAVANGYDATISVLLGYGNGSFADFNNDTHLDIAVVAVYSIDISILLGYGDGYFAEPITHFIGPISQSVSVGHFNNDTILDIAIVSGHFGKVLIYLGTRKEIFVTQKTLTIGNSSRPHTLIIGDFNNDNYKDIAVVCVDAQNITIYLGYGDLSFANQSAFSAGLDSSSYAIAAGDFNNDTRLDIVVTNYNSNFVSIFLGNGDGSFGNQK